MKSHNHRRQFLGKLSAMSLGTLLPFPKRALAENTLEDIPTACTLIPAETRGPYPLFNASDIASQTALVRSDIKETQTGVPLSLSITVQNLSCVPIQGAKVYIWHCSKNGLYSGYSTGANAGQAGLTYLRGIQTTDTLGQVNFSTIYPGWYMGRLTHIHVEVYVGNVLLHTSQFAFPLDSVTGSATALVNASYGNSNNTITSYSADNVFSDGYTEQLLSLTGNVSAGYTTSHTFILDYSVVPVHLISFKAGVENKNPMLWWIAENESDVSYYEVEQSNHPSKNYVASGSVVVLKFGSGANNYSFALQKPLTADITYFRLKVWNENGTFTYSQVVTLHSSLFDSLSLVNSSANDVLLIRHPSVYANSVLKIVNISGQLLATGNLKTGVSLTSIDVKKLTKGVYFLIIETGIDRYVTKFYKE